MHLLSNAVSNELFHHAVTIRLTMTLHRIADIANPPTGQRGLDAQIKRLLCHPQKPLHIRRDLADTERVTRITVISVQQRAAVYRHHITVLQRTVIRNAMHHHFIDRRANRCRKRPPVRVGIPFESGNRPVVPNELLRQTVQLPGGDTGPDVPGDLCQRVCYQQVGGTHQLYLILRLKEYHIPDKLTKLCRTAMNPA